jgi:hypothetical protein
MVPEPELPPALAPEELPPLVVAAPPDVVVAPPDVVVAPPDVVVAPPDVVVAPPELAPPEVGADPPWLPGGVDGGTSPPQPMRTATLKTEKTDFLSMGRIRQGEGGQIRRPLPGRQKNPGETPVSRGGAPSHSDC